MRRVAVESSPPHWLLAEEHDTQPPKDTVKLDSLAVKPISLVFFGGIYVILEVAKQKPKSAFGQRLRELREAAKMTQEELGALAGMAYQTIAKYERGASVPTWQTVEKLADALGVKTDDFRLASETE